MERPRLGRACLLALTMAVGCKPAPRPPRTSPAEEATRPALTAAEVERIIAGVSASRAIPIKREVTIEWLSKSELRREVAKRAASEDSTSELSLDDAFLVGFDFVPPPAKRGEIAPMSEVLAEQVAAFYDVEADKVFVPRSEKPTAKQAMMERAILAHEIQHALQAQNFARPADGRRSSDQALAELALIEGDAMVAMGAFMGSEMGAPVGRTLRRIRETVESIPREAIAHRTEDRALARAIELARQRLSFPYEEGMFFVSDIYRAGGFPLVDAAFARPPRSTEQILHPEKYLRDEQPRAFRDLAPPAGVTMLGADSLGELQTRILLERCIPREEAAAAAAGWGGDRFFALAKERALAMAWVSALDSEDEAKELEAALASANGCFADNEVKGRSIGASFVVQRKGTTVAFVRGFDPTTQKELVRALLGLPGEVPAARPLTTQPIPPRVPLPEPTKGTVEAGVYRNDWLGLVGRVPKGMRARTDDTDLELFIDRSDAVVSGALAISTRITSDEQNEKAFGDVQRAFKKALKEHGLSLSKLGGGTIKTELGAGVDRSWRVNGTAVELRAVLIPICAGTGAIVFVESYAGSFARSVLDGWIGSFRFAEGRSLRACDYLDPK